MTSVTLAIIVATDGTRYKLSGWRNGSHKTTAPKRPARLTMLTDERGWKTLEEWNGAESVGVSHRPKADHVVFDEALQRLEVNYGVDVEEVILQKSTETNHLDHTMGWGHKSGDWLEDFDATVIEG